MIETYKIVNNVYDGRVTKNLLPEAKETRTRGNTKKLEKGSFRKDIRKFTFSQRVVNNWNDLPNSVVEAQTIKIFETRLDNYWETQEVLYNAEADLVLCAMAGS